MTALGVLAGHVLLYRRQSHHVTSTQIHTDTAAVIIPQIYIVKHTLAMKTPGNLRVETWKREVRTATLWRDTLAEFIMTFMLMSVQAALPLTWRAQPGADQGLMGGPVQVGIGMGFIVACMAWALGDFGGGHINPAVTVAMLACAKITLVRGQLLANSALYIIHILPILLSTSMLL